MTGRTHDLAAFTALNYVVATQPLQVVTLPTVLVAIGANMLGGLAPDIDQTTSSFWRHVRGGRIISRLISPLLGGHRFISHSLLGIFIFGFLTEKILQLMSTFLIVDINLVWWAFMIGFVSHLVMDSLSREGVPWLFPIPIKFGVPPISALRMKTGGILEKAFVFPGLILINGYIFYAYYPKILEFLRQYIK
jgi:inner membrane protein